MVHSYFLSRIAVMADKDAENTICLREVFTPNNEDYDSEMLVIQLKEIIVILWAESFRHYTVRRTDKMGIQHWTKLRNNHVATISEVRGMYYVHYPETT